MPGRVYRPLNPFRLTSQIVFSNQNIQLLRLIVLHIIIAIHSTKSSPGPAPEQMPAILRALLTNSSDSLHHILNFMKYFPATTGKVHQQCDIAYLSFNSIMLHINNCRFAEKATIPGYKGLVLTDRPETSTAT